MRTCESGNVTKEEERNFSTRRRSFLSLLTCTCPWKFGGPLLEGYYRRINGWRKKIHHPCTRGGWNETPVNPIKWTYYMNHKANPRKSQHCLESCWNFWRRKGLIPYRRVKQVKNSERRKNATAHPIQKASIDKMKEEKMNFETTELSFNTEVKWTVSVELPEATLKHYFMERTRTNNL